MIPVNMSIQSAKDYFFEHDPIFNADGKQQNSCWIGKGAQELGLSGEIRPDGKVEIAGISRELNESFSKRRDEIDKTEQKLLEKGVFPNASEGSLRNIAVLESRSGKNIGITGEELKASWIAQMYEKGFTIEGITQDIENAIQKESLSVKSL